MTDGDEPRRNAYGQPIGRALPGWSPPPFPAVDLLEGRCCRVEALTTEHSSALYRELCGPGDESLWTYLGDEPFDDAEQFRRGIRAIVRDPGIAAVAIRDADGVACGLARLMRVDRPNGAVEVGGIVLGRRLQRTTAATEAMYLLARHVFDLGYRRYEWKCDALNEPSRRAALRLGFRYEGRFRDAVVYKGRSRDTDWFSITADEWPRVRAALEAWLDPANHGPDGQRQSLATWQVAAD